MFEKRKDLTKFLAVAETGAILSAADKLGITQPALSRVVARLERQFGGRLFDRMSTGVRLTPLGAVVADLAHHILYEIEVAEEKINATLSGRTGCLRVTAGPMWMGAVLPEVIAGFHETCPGVELKLKTTPLSEGIRLLANGDSDLHCGGINGSEPLPQFLRSERFLDMTWGIVAHRDHPLHSGTAGDEALADYPWIDYDAPLRADAANGRPSLTQVLDQLHDRTGKRVKTVTRGGSAGLSLMRAGPYLSWLSLTFLDRIPGHPLKPVPVAFGSFRYRAGMISRRSADDLSPFGIFRDIVRDVASSKEE